MGCSVCRSPISLTSNAAAWPLTSTLTDGSALASMDLVFDVASGKDGRHEVQHVGGADLAVAVVADHAVLHHVDLLLRVAIDHRAHQAGELDAVLLVLEQLQLQRLLQPLVGAE